MSPAPGSRIGHYEISSHLGSGGMGEVFRATDTQLGRQVALKVLPDSVVADAQRLARFDREARTLALLNHPNIAQIYGVAEGGDGGHSRALVMELVEGPTLADRIAEAPIPLDETLAIARQIADGLEAAHDLGIVHRDLKPANIKVRPDGRVKVLDFGLAKAIEGGGDAAKEMAATMSPTITTPAMTAAGMILGTAAYMSPEQARGRTVDRRTDIWAFGCVLFEMLTGKRAFPGDDVTDTLAAIVRGEPEWDALPADVPARVRKALQLCVQKDPARRIRDVADVRMALDGAFETAAAQSAVAASVPASPRSRVALWAMAGALVLVAAAAAIGWTRRPASTAPEMTRFAIPLAAGDAMPESVRPILGFALSPDERSMIYSVFRKDVPQVFRRNFGELVAMPISGTERGYQPFFSPDGKWIAFFADAESALKKVDAAGGVPVRVTAIPQEPRFATWLSDGTIVFGMRQRPLMKVADSGGEATPLVALEKGEVELLEPAAVPGRRAVVFTSRPDNVIYAFDLDAGKRMKLIDGSSPHVTNGGQLVFIRDGALWSAPFDSRRLTVIGEAKPALTHTTAGSGILEAALGANGTLVYLTGRSSSGAPRTYALSWVESHGKAEPLSLPARAYEYPRVSPDGTRLAVSVQTERGKGVTESDLWVYDLRTGAGLRLTHDGDNRLALWTADGQRIFYSSTHDAAMPPGFEGTWWGNLYAVRADGSRDPERLTTSKESQALTGISPDGRELFYTRLLSNQDWQVMRIDAGGAGEPTALTSGQFLHASGELSPNGRLISYRSTESGKYEIYVQPYPSLDGKIAVSVGGGLEPIWSADSKTLFYRIADRVMAVDIVEKPLRASAPRELFSGPYRTAGTGARQFHVGADGRFVMMNVPRPESTQASEEPPFVAVLNWLRP